jgi:hypothetical protein
MDWLRNSQGYCTDNQCINPQLNNPQAGPSDPSGASAPPTLFLMLLAWLLIIVGLLLFRPRGARRSRGGDHKPDRPFSDRDLDRDPPAVL